MYRRSLEKSNPWRQKAECWLSGTRGRGNGGSAFKGDRISVVNDEKVMEMDGSDIDTT